MDNVSVRPGIVVGERFLVERLLGEGGMGTVFAAYNTVTGRHVALKWMRPEIAASTEARDRFLREAHVSGRLRHPNVVDVYDVIADEGSLFLVMELLEGETLAELLQRRAATVPQLLSLLCQAMRGVAAAHAHGIVHRDIKPENIFLARQQDTTEPVPKVLDFGVSKLVGKADVSITLRGATLGTPLYMPTEQLSGLGDVDERVDVYAFGVILYQIVTGRMPFEADSLPLLITKIMTETPGPPKTVRPSVPESLSLVIEAAMAKDRSQRIASIAALMQRLRPFTAAATGPPPPGRAAPELLAPPVKETFAPVAASSPERLRVPGRRRLAPVLTAGLLCALAAVGLWWIERRGGAAAEHYVSPAAVPSVPRSPAVQAPQAQPLMAAEYDGAPTPDAANVSSAVERRAPNAAPRRSTRQRDRPRRERAAPTSLAQPIRVFDLPAGARPLRREEF